MWMCKTFSHPFCYTIDVQLVNSYCYFCLKKLPLLIKDVERIICSNCKFARFCNEECREKCKVWHEDECKLLQKVFPNVPHTLVLFFSRLIRQLKENKIKIDEEIIEPNVSRDRKWAHLMTHLDSFIKDRQKLQGIKILYQLTSEFLRGTYTVSKDEFLYMFCKKNINSHGIYNNFGLLVGESMDYQGSLYDHSCRPTIGISFEGVEMTFRSLEPNLDLDDRSKAFVSYTELAQSKHKRRKELMEKYYFYCQCVRCSDPEDDKIVSIRCSNKICDEPIAFHEDQLPEDTFCSKCQTKIPKEAIENGLSCISLIEKCLTNETVSEKGIEVHNYCSQVLHPMNVYLSDLWTTYMQESLATKVNLDTALEFGIKALPCLRKCYPKYHKCLAFHLLKLAYIEIYLQDISNVLEYVNEGSSILRIWFGQEYPICIKLEMLIEKLTSKNNWIVTSELLKYFKFE